MHVLSNHIRFGAYRDWEHRKWPLTLHETIPGSVENLFDPESESEESASLHTKDEEQLSTQELREIYDEEEIERFLQLFAAVSMDADAQKCSDFLCST